jgi:hypothetical protein
LRPEAASPEPRAAQAASSARSRGPSFAPVALVVALLLAGTVAGASYYFAPAADRVRDPLHPWLRSSGYVGQTAGVIALLIFAFLWLYPFRKSVRALRWTGSLARWLDVHVATALILPVLTAVHASWRFDGLIGLGFWSMIVVCASGVIGRYLYVHIPRSATGLELSADEIAAERREMLAQLAEATGLPQAQVESILRSDPTPCDGLGVLATFGRMITDEIARFRQARALRRLCRNKKRGHRLDHGAVRRVVRLARREMALSQQARMLAATHRMFRLWHVAHRPFAITALVAVTVHVAVVVSMGMTWFW